MHFVECMLITQPMREQYIAANTKLPYQGEILCSGFACHKLGFLTSLVTNKIMK